MATDDYSPIFQGDTGNPFAIQVLYGDGTPKDISGATITMKMELMVSVGGLLTPTGTIQTCNGPWTIDDATKGKAHYQWQPGDVATTGVWGLYPVVTIGGLPVHLDGGNGIVKTLNILPIPQ